MSPRARDHLASLKAQADEAIERHQAARRRTLREVEIRDALVVLVRELVDHYAMQRPFAVKASIQQGQRLVEELDELHAAALGVPVMVREVA